MDTNDLPHEIEAAPESPPEAPKSETEKEAPAPTSPTLDERLARSEAALRLAAKAYRALVLKSNPDIPQELISGETVEDIERSLEGARELVGRVKERLERRASSSHIPPGAPERGGVDINNLSPAEKIKYGIEKEVNKWR